MIKIGILLQIKPHCGGSYQYWFSVLKALSLLDKSKYEIYGIYQDEEWGRIVDSFGISKCRYYIKRKNTIQTIIERLLWKYKTDLLRNMLTKMQHDIEDVKKLDLDYIFADSSLGIASMIARKSIIPIHDLMHRYEREIPEMQEGYEYREQLYKKETEIADVILVDSEVGKRHVVESYSECREKLAEHIEILPFIPPSYIYEQKEAKMANISLPNKYIFYPAQFWAHKNHLRLLEAVNMLKQEGIIVKLILVGSEQNNSIKVVDYINELGLNEQVTILGYVSNEEMVYLYRHARALVMPTLMGPTNIPPLEAFVLGCPVATSKIYGIPEQLKDAALLFDPRNVNEIAECIEKLWLDDDLCSGLIQKGLVQSEEWGLPQFSDRIEEILLEHIK